MRAGFSARHVSFIETGRSQPSRQAVLVLAEALDVPLRDRNRLLEAGGYAHVYRHTPLDAEDMRHIRGVLQFILDRHEPFGAVVLDRYSNLLMANAASQELFRTIVDPGLIAETHNIMRLVFHESGLRPWIVNWPEVAEHLLSRCERELGGPSADETSRALLADIRRLAGPSATARHQQPLKPADVLLPGTHPPRRDRRPTVQRDHDARHSAGRHAPGASDRDVLSGGSGVRENDSSHGKARLTGLNSDGEPSSRQANRAYFASE